MNSKFVADYTTYENRRFKSRYDVLLVVILLLGHQLGKVGATARETEANHGSSGASDLTPGSECGRAKEVAAFESVCRG
jgi:hypothetical protein